MARTLNTLNIEKNGKGFSFKGVTLRKPAPMQGAMGALILLAYVRWEPTEAE